MFLVVCRKLFNLFNNFSFAVFSQTVRSATDTLQHPPPSPLHLLPSYWPLPLAAFPPAASPWLHLLLLFGPSKKNRFFRTGILTTRSSTSRSSSLSLTVNSAAAAVHLHYSLLFFFTDTVCVFQCFHHLAVLLTLTHCVYSSLLTLCFIITGTFLRTRSD